ncbi:methyltransferase protein [Elysia marginata]|uniref:Methyltransferase protein n=1 Tax=Elysia marginata TaxID=1093978 RepID=A0AAV4IDM5_9GAST|nr:methyltransferase protein [Elysia marginata]
MDKIPSGPDLCKVWKENLYNSAFKIEEQEKQWWEWACHLEMEWDKEPEYLCRDQRHVANYQACFDEPYKPSPHCLVYSFGINNDFRFEDKMAQYGCHVYSFDPSMNTESYNRSERVHFINMGIGTSNSDTFKPKIDGYTINSNKKWQIRTLPAIKKMLGHENKILDVLKMDIESYEWKVIKDLLEDTSLLHSKQLLLEWHIFANEPMRTEFPAMYQTYKKLKMKAHDIKQMS